MVTKIKLSQDTLDQYFNLADTTNSHFKKPTNTLDFVGIDSKHLVVTIGDSCTWGSDLEQLDNNFRLAHVYGRLVADKLNADWLNLALAGSGNFWIADQVEALAKIVPILSYDKIYVICTFTEPGRHFDTESDRYIDYATWLEVNIKEYKDYYKLLEFLNQECINRIYTALNPFKNIKVCIGNNAIEPLGLEQADNDLLKKSWLQVMAEQLNFNYSSENCYVNNPESTTARLENVLEIQPKLKRSDFLTWMIEIMNVAEQRKQSATVKPYISGWHPNSIGHEIWANYILESLDDN
jgi:lysophospholipase L1-like esterase